MLASKFIESILHALNNNVTLPEGFYSKMERLAVQRSTTIAGLAQVEQIKFIMQQLQTSLDSGGSFEDFVSRVQDNSLDITLPTYRLDNIFRTNLQMAYAVGRYQQQQDNKKSRPYLQYSAIHDSRTRPSHMALDGIIKPVDDPFWDDHTPPIAFRCRCSVISLTQKQADALGGVTDDDGLPIMPASSFTFKPANYVSDGANLVDEMAIDDIVPAGMSITANMTSVFNALKNRIKDSLIAIGIIAINDDQQSTD